jgi:hypothetical protein
MKRDMDLVRGILLKLEPLPAHFGRGIPLTIVGHTRRNRARLFAVTGPLGVR